MTTTLLVSASADDAAQAVSTGVVTLTDATISIDTSSGGTAYMGIRFASVPIDKSATVGTTTLNLYFPTGKGPNIDVTIYAQAIDNAPTFTTATNSISSRTRTTANVVWTHSSETISQYDPSPNIASVIQEVVNRSGWVNGNGLVLILVARSTNIGSVNTFEGSHPPQLSVASGLLWRPSESLAAPTETLVSTRIKPRTASDAPGAANDGLVRQFTGKRLASETFTSQGLLVGGTSLGTEAYVGGPLTSASPQSDAATRTAFLNRSASDSTTTSDAAVKSKILSRSATDNGTTVFAPVTETLTTTDNAAGTNIGPGTITRTATDSVAGLSDVAVKSKLYFRTAADNGTTIFRSSAEDVSGVSDSALRVYIAVRNLAENTKGSLADSQFQQGTYFRAGADSSTTTDAATRTEIYGRVVGDTTSTSDIANQNRTLVRQTIDNGTTVFRSCTETLTTTDAVTTFFKHVRATNDSSTTADAATRSSGAFGRASPDTFTTTDATTSTAIHVRGLSETVTQSDAAVQGRVAARTASDATGTPATGLTQRYIAVRPAAETVTPTDALSSLRDVVRAATDSVSGLSEMASSGRLAVVAASDTVTTTDSLGTVRTTVRSVTDTVTPGDAVTTGLTHCRSLTETVTPTETATRAVVEGRTGTDAVTPSEVAFRSVIRSRTASDALAAATDNATRFFPVARTSSDSTAGLTDAPVRVLTSNRVPADTLTTADATTSSGIYVRAPSDDVSGTLTDSADGLLVHIQPGDAVDDISGLIDTLVTVRIVTRSAVDTAPATDGEAGLNTYARSGFDSVSAGSVDAVARLGVHPRTTTETIPAIVDNLAQHSTLGRAITEAPGALTETATLSGAAIYARSISDTVSGLADTAQLGFGVIYPRTATDNVSTLSESPAVTPVRVRASTDIVTPTETVDALHTVLINASDSVPTPGEQLNKGISRTGGDLIAAPLDAPMIQGHYLRSCNDASTTSDGAQRVVVRPRVIAESLLLTESTTRLYISHNNATDNVSFKGDTQNIFAIHPRSSSDSMPSATDATASQRIALRNTNESIPLFDAAVVARMRNASDNVTGTADVATNLRVYKRSASDSAVPGDVATGLKARVVTGTDTLTTTDALARLDILRRSSTETVTPVEVATQNRLVRRNASDAATAPTDAATWAPAHVVSASDTVPVVGDAAVRSAGIFHRAQNINATAVNATASETLTTSDSATGSRFRLFVRTAADNGTMVFAVAFDAIKGSLNDAPTRALVMTRQVVEHPSQERAGSETLTTTDTLASFRIRKRTAADAVPAPNDTVTRAGHNYQQTGDDTLPAITDTAARTATTRRAATDAPGAPVDLGARLFATVIRRSATDTAGFQQLGTGEQAVRSSSSTRSAVENFATGDSPVRSLLYVRSGDEDLSGLTDDAAGLRRYLHAASDVVPTPTDTITVAFSPLKQRTARDTVTPIEGAVRSGGLFFRATGDTIPVASESLAGGRLFERTAADAVTGLTDAATRAQTARRNFAEVTTINETVVRATSYARAFAEALSIADVLGRHATQPRTVTEIVAIVTEASTHHAVMMRSGAEQLLAPATTAVRISVHQATNQPPIVTITGISRPVVSLIAGSNESVITMSFDMPVQAWIVRNGGNGPFDGDLLAEASYTSTAPVNADVATIDASRLLRGTNQIRVYAQSVAGVWSS